MIQNRLTGTISANLSLLQRLQMLRLDQNMLTGRVPEEWGAADAFPGGLTVLTLFNNRLTGTLYNSWGSPHAFPSLQLLSLNGMGIGGTLPDSWASSLGAFQSLRILYLGSVNLAGTIPASWGSTQGFPSLECLWLDDSVVRGVVPAFDNVKLAILILANMSLTSDLNGFWGSSAPLTQVDLSYNYIEGYLPADAAILHTMQFLKMRWNSLQGTVPLSWLQEGGALSHMPFVDLGQIWHDSVAQNG